MNVTEQYNGEAPRPRGVIPDELQWVRTGVILLNRNVTLITTPPEGGYHATTLLAVFTERLGRIASELSGIHALWFSDIDSDHSRHIAYGMETDGSEARLLGRLSVADVTILAGDSRARKPYLKMQGAQARRLPVHQEAKALDVFNDGCECKPETTTPYSLKPAEGLYATRITSALMAVPMLYADGTRRKAGYVDVLDDLAGFEDAVEARKDVYSNT